MLLSSVLIDLFSFFIWNSNLHEKNRITRGQNCAIGRLGQYIVGDPDKEYRLIDKLKAVSSRNNNPGKTAPTGFDVTGVLKRTAASRKPSILEPLTNDPATQAGMKTSTNRSFAGRHGS